MQIRHWVESIVFIEIKENLLEQNSAFHFFHIEGPTLIPTEFISKSYNETDIFVTNENGIALRPETTASSYLYAQQILDPHNMIKTKPPLVVWQHGKSYRKEKDKPSKYMRLKEFYQLEFQIIFHNSTKNDYSVTLIPLIRRVLEGIIGECVIEPSDRIPEYSEMTTDIVCKDNGMEICSISKRSDFPDTELKVLEVAIGTDRCIYNKLRFDSERNISL